MKINSRLLTAMGCFAVIHSVFGAPPDVQQLAAANNIFGFKLLKQLVAEKPGASVFVSPYSAATALQMARNGAAGQTKMEMDRVLETAGLTTAALNAASKAASAWLNAKDTNVFFTTANALWYQQGAAVKPDFLESNRKYFSSTVKALDMRNTPAAEAEINKWASDQTHGRITGIADGLLTPYTDLILANAIYFKGKWLNPFDTKLTKEHPFHSANGALKNIPMMEVSKILMYRKGSGYQAVRLPYMGHDFAMYVFLPDSGSSPAKLLQIINGDNWRQVTMPGFSERLGRLVLPKFKLENTLKLKPALIALGMKAAFNNQKMDSPDADFSGMFGDRHFLSDVRQEALVEINEDGTEAAAMTIIGLSPAAVVVKPPKPFEMIMDRPFMFAIVDARSEMILFMGVVNQL
jgi:serpin B